MMGRDGGIKAHGKAGRHMPAHGEIKVHGKDGRNMPAKGGIKARRTILLMIWIASLTGISFYGGAISYGLFFCVTLLPVISFIYLFCVFERFRIYQEIESRNIVCRQPMPYYFMLQNSEKYSFAGISARLFSGLSYVEEMPENVEYELLPGDCYTFRTRLVCK